MTEVPSASRCEYILRNKLKNKKKTKRKKVKENKPKDAIPDLFEKWREGDLNAAKATRRSGW